MDRTIQPELKSNDLHDIQRPELHTMKNGVAMNCVHVKDTQLLRIDIMFKGGQWVQNSPLQAKFALSQLRYGSAEYDKKRISELIDYYGASIQTRVNLSYSVITLTVLSKFLRQALAILRSVITSPIYEEEQLRIVLSQAKTSYAVSLETVDTHSLQLFYKSLFGSEHPLGVYPLLSDYDALTTEQLFEYHQKYLHSGNATLYLTGDYDQATISIVEDCLGADKWGCSDKSVIFDSFRCYPVNTTQELRQTVSVANSSHQSSIKMGCLLPSRKNADYYALSLFTTIIGGYFGSRLMSSVRETYGYTYDIHSVISQIPHHCAFVVTTETAPQNVEAVIKEVKKQIRLLAQVPVTDEELRIVKNYVYGNYCRSTEGGFSLPSAMMKLEALGLDLDTVRKEQYLIQASTPETILECANKYIKEDSLLTCIAECAR